MPDLCKLCGETFEECTCERTPEDHSGETLCETCPDKLKCEAREDEPAILHAQIEHCHEIVGRADFRSDEQWIFDWQQEKREEEK